MEKAGMGHWYGGFIGDRLACSLGIFHARRGAQVIEWGLGHFQNVATDPEFRRQSLCGTLVYKTAGHAFAKTPSTKLIICADSDYFAIKIYESVGFQRESTEYGVYRWDRSRG